MIHMNSQISYYSNGKTKRIEFLRHGALHGAWQCFYENGNLCSKGTYKNGKKYGRWSGYYEDGSLYYTEYYKNDILTGTYTIYYPSGAVKRKVEYKERLVQAKKDKIFYENGTLRKVNTYGWYQQYKYFFDKKGRLEEKITTDKDFLNIFRIKIKKYSSDKTCIEQKSFDSIWAFVKQGAK